MITHFGAYCCTHYPSKLILVYQALALALLEKFENYSRKFPNGWIVCLMAGPADEGVRDGTLWLTAACA